MRERGGGPRSHALGSVLPGAPQLLEGRWGAGGLALIVWVGALAVMLLRPGSVVAALALGPWGWMAVAVLFGAPATAWSWCRRDTTRTVAGRTDDRVGGVFEGNGLAAAGAVVLALLYLCALLAPVLAPFDPTAPGDLATARWSSPSTQHLLGTDQLARDVLSRLLYGARISLTIGLLAVTIAASLGTAVGAVAGYVGGWVDTVLMRAVDLVLAFPRLVLLIALVALFDPSVTLIVCVLGLTLWPDSARLVRAEVLSLRERDFVTAARSLGYSRRRILTRHVVPNALPPVIVAATLGVGNVIVLEAGLSFLGLGVQAPTPTWGGMVADGRSDLLHHWWLSTFSGLAIVATVLAFNVVGDGLRDALDPRGRRR